MADDYRKSELYNEMPIILNAKNIVREFIECALKFREYYIDSPSEVIIDNNIIKSIVLHDTDINYVICKLILKIIEYHTLLFTNIVLPWIGPL